MNGVISGSLTLDFRRKTSPNSMRPRPYAAALNIFAQNCCSISPMEGRWISTAWACCSMNWLLGCHRTITQTRLRCRRTSSPRSFECPIFQEIVLIWCNVSSKKIQTGGLEAEEESKKSKSTHSLQKSAGKTFSKRGTDTTSNISKSIWPRLIFHFNKIFSAKMSSMLASMSQKNVESLPRSARDQLQRVCHLWTSNTWENRGQNRSASRSWRSVRWSPRRARIRRAATLPLMILSKNEKN